MHVCTRLHSCLTWNNDRLAVDLVPLAIGLTHAIIDGGACHLDPTSVIDLRELPPKIIREGRGDISPFVV